MQRNNYRVYKHTCLAPGNSYGKVYIGITCQKSNNRWGLRGQKYGHCLYLDNAIKKYGWENFSHEILEEGLYRSEAKRAERKYIRQFNSDDPQFGFNLTPGGDRLAGEESPVSRPVVAFDAVSGIRVADYDSVSDVEREIGGSPSSVLSGKAKTTQGLILRYLDDVGLTMVLPEEERHRPRSQPEKEKPINQYGLDGKYIRTFKSISEAESELKYSRGMIGNAARGASKKAGDYQWRLDTGDHSDIEPYVPPYEVRKANGGYVGRRIDQIDPKTGEILHTYDSVREAARAINGNRRNMLAVAEHKPGKHTANGFGWEFHEE